VPLGESGLAARAHYGSFRSTRQVAVCTKAQSKTLGGNGLMFDYIIELPARHIVLKNKFYQAQLPAKPDIGQFKFFKLERYLFRRSRTGCYLLVNDNPEVAAIG